jgi:hypothetical protein
MNSHVKRLTLEASQLPPEDRVELVEGILRSLDTISPDLDRKWADEATERLSAYRRGEIEVYDLDEALLLRRTKAK